MMKISSLTALAPMMTRTIAAMAAFGLLHGTSAMAQPAGAGLMKAWPKDGPWLTELRRDADGSHTCITGAAFSSPHAFVLEIASRPDIFALMLIDKEAGGTGASRLAVTLDGAEVARLPIEVSGPARLTRADESTEVRALLPRLAQAHSAGIAIGDTTYEIQPGGLAEAARSLAACEQEAGIRPGTAGTGAQGRTH
ncbi:hypothetical protein [Bordetella flabilis]|uniref:Invasion associated locus B family protein n=1 Tax=Bordetella flabilis TaxID=463014 RepID=A0A193GAR7_9BORD|nr:hypothetical protein [Bordetella flabilis]ANN76930.1 hypothetical protein BAU07_07210 [Bordetella flabilis]